MADYTKAEEARQQNLKVKIINENLKQLYESVKDALEKADEEIFNEAIGPRYLVREAKNHNKVHSLFNVLNKKLGAYD